MLLNVFLDDVRDPSDVPELAKISKSWVVARDIETVKRLLTKRQVAYLSLDHDLGVDKDGKILPTGYDLVCWMEQNDRWPTKDTFVHSANPVGRQKMAAAIQAKKNRDARLTKGR